MKISFNPKENTVLGNVDISLKTPVLLESAIIGYVDSVTPESVTCEIFDMCITCKAPALGRQCTPGIVFISPVERYSKG